MNDLIYVLAGFGVGAIVGLTGVGGGSLMTPLLIFAFGVKPHLAVGTDLLFAAFTKLGGSVQLARSKRIDWPVVGALCAGSIPASLVTLAWLHQVGTSSPGVERLMKTALGLALLLTAGATLYKAWIAHQPHPRPVDARTASTKPHGEGVADTQPRHPALPVLLGAGIGVLVTLSSVGAGAIGVTALLLIYPRLPLPRVVAADIAYAVPLTLVAGLGHAGLGSVDWGLLAKLLIGSIPGIWLGSHLILRLPQRAVRTTLSGLLAYTGLKLLAI